MAKQASCHSCVYAHWDRCLWMRSLGTGWPAWPTCGNHPDSYGRMKECPHTRVCRNYRARPPVPQGEGVKTIPLGGGLYAYVDAADFEWLNQWTWRVQGGYAVRHVTRDGKHKVVFMHREIMKPPPGKVTDHINGNKLDNTRANLRNVTHKENMHNRVKQIGCVSMYKGVSYNERRHQWRAYIHVGKKCFHLGYFDTEVEAAQAYDRAAVEMFGEFARLNFPEEWPARRRREVHARWQREQAKHKGRPGARRGHTRARTKTPGRQNSKSESRNPTCPPERRRACRTSPKQARKSKGAMTKTQAPARKGPKRATRRAKRVTT